MKGEVSINQLQKFHFTKRGTKFLVLALLPTYFLAAGLIIQPWKDIWKGLLTIVQEPDFLITDYVAIGGIGAAFVNASLLTLISIFIVYRIGLELDGHTITSIFLMMGFSLFGKNILNIWSILLGVWVYSRYHKTKFSKYVYIAFYGTSLSPVITMIMQLGHLPSGVKLPLSILVGMLIGFVLPPLSAHVHGMHKGYSLYNVGFSAGIIATVIVSVFRSFGIETETRLIWSTGNNVIFTLLLLTFFSIMIAAGALYSKEVWKHYRNILRYPGIGGTDYMVSEGFAATLMNMGVNGIFAVLFVAAVGGELNGPTMGGIFTIVGFSATGKHIRNIFPVMLGVYLASFAKEWNISDPAPMITLLFSTTLAPIAGEYGILAGIFTGFLHSSVALNVGIIYGGMNLYNNGFAGGIIAAFVVPVLDSFRDRRARAKEEELL